MTTPIPLDSNPTFSGYALAATAPPLPAPGRILPDTLGWMQVWNSPLDLFFFHSWPDEINEGLTTQWFPYNFVGASAPLAYLYKGNQWDPFEVKLQLHASNVSLPQMALRKTGIAPGGVFGIDIGLGLLELFRIQMQVAWCKSICLPNTDKQDALADSAIRQYSSATTIDEAINATKKLLQDTFATGQQIIAGILNKGLYGGTLFPPLIATQYGGFLRMYGFCDSLQVRWLPPFIPVIALPHRAEVTLHFQRLFPVNLPNKRRALSHFGYMM